MAEELPEINREMFQKIHDLLVTDPNSHNQSDWETHTTCGTARCVAGWAYVMHTGKTWTQGEREFLRLGISPEHPETQARDILGLTESEASDLFSGLQGEESAARKVEHYALKGREGIEYEDHGIYPLFPWEQGGGRS